VDRRDEGDGVGGEEGVEDANRERGRLVDDDDVGVARQVGRVGGGAVAHAAGRRVEAARRRPVAVVGQGVAVLEEYPRTSEDLGGVCKAGRGHEHVVAFEGKGATGETGGARLAPAPVGLDDDGVALP
jgi:hypothetical protein